MSDVNKTIHQPVRLQIMAAVYSLGPGAQVDFTFLRDSLALSDGNLGAHLAKLESAGYLAVDKAFVNRRPKTSVKLSLAGRRAFEDYVETMNRIIESSKNTPKPQS